MSELPTPETDAAEFTAGPPGEEFSAVEAFFARKLEQERDAAQNELNKVATQLVATINDRNSIGTQLDLVRDELKRISARIVESGMADNPRLSEIIAYCQRAQEDIAVRYTPIQERDKAKSDLAKATYFIDCALRERDAWKAKAERTCKHVRIQDGQSVGECGNTSDAFDEFCSGCGGQIVKDKL